MNSELTLVDDPVRCPVCLGYGHFADRHPNDPDCGDGEPCTVCTASGSLYLSEVLDKWQNNDFKGYDVDSDDILEMVCDAIIDRNEAQMYAPYQEEGDRTLRRSA